MSIVLENHPSANQISNLIWDEKYRQKSFDGISNEKTLEDTFRRVANAVGSAYSEYKVESTTDSELFYEMLSSLKFLPGGRILAGAGTRRNVTLMNCYVMGDIRDSMIGIMKALEESARTLQQGGGIGMNFSTIRPRGAKVNGVDATASGPISFMEMWDTMCKTIMSAGNRRGAMMGTLLVSHPDIEEFIEAKHTKGRLCNFNLSVLVTDEFMKAVQEDKEFVLHFDGVAYRKVKARELWEKIMQSTYRYSEPGVLFIDTINKENPLKAVETITATNPCGEQPLPPYGSCLLGSINLTQFVKNPFPKNGEIAKFDYVDMANTVAVAVKFLDNIIDITKYPSDQFKIVQKERRRMGIGITGLANVFAMMGFRYGDTDSLKFLGKILYEINHAAKGESRSLAKIRGAFPIYTRYATVAANYHKPTRNSHLMSIQPTGTISLLAGNVSSGIEPVFANKYYRRIIREDGTLSTIEVKDYAVGLFESMYPGEELPEYFVTMKDVSIEDHINVLKIAQSYCDGAVSKTINCPEGYPYEKFKEIYLQAYKSGCKGCTTYIPSETRGAVLMETAQTVSPEIDQAKSEMKEISQSLSELNVLVDELKKEITNTEPPAVQPHIMAQSTVDEVEISKISNFEPLNARRYKIKWPDQDAHYLFIVDDKNGKPFEFFIVTKNPTNYPWVAALTRTISSVLRLAETREKAMFIAEELKEIFDPKGGAWIGQKFWPSIQAVMGEILAWHLHASERNRAVHSDQGMGSTPAPAGAKDHPAPVSAPLPTCPKCHNPTLIKNEGCDFCPSCSYSKCS